MNKTEAPQIPVSQHAPSPSTSSLLEAEQCIPIGLLMEARFDARHGPQSSGQELQVLPAATVTKPGFSATKLEPRGCGKQQV